jgi:hypothetical protein
MDFKRVAAAGMTIVFALAISSASAVASEKTDVVAAVHRYFDNIRSRQVGNGAGNV